jgi:Skp family chaperone for outer membrane proteins
MWQQLVDFGKRLFAQARNIEQHDEDIRALREEMKAMREEMVQLAQALQQVKLEHQHDRGTAAQASEILLLRLENALLPFERRLSLGAPKSDAPAL